MSHFVRSPAIARVILLLVLVLVPLRLGAQEASAPPPGSGEEQRLLVLQDGGVLSGKIHREGEHYVVETRGGGRLQIAASNVMLVCGSLEEAYRSRRQQMARSSADAHLAMAEWCLRNDLLAQAERELAEAKSLEPRHARLALLQRRLTVASQERPAAEPTAAKAAPAPVSSAESPRANPVVPHRVLERFTRKVQPVLVNNCTESGCHQRGGAEPFQLDRGLLHGLANRRSTMSNLAAALALVDREQPERSPLLTVPRRTHGGMEDAVFGPRQEQAYRHLVDWVALVVQSKPVEPQVAPAAELLADALARGEQTLTAEETPPNEPTLSPDAKAIPAAADGVMQASYEQAAPSLAPLRQPLRVGAQLEKWQPRDPFDPEIFNRRYSKASSAGQAAEPSPEPATR